MEITEFKVFIIPPKVWSKPLHSTPNFNVYDFIYVGNFRIDKEKYIFETRKEIGKQLAQTQYGKMVPKQFVFCRSVGRCFTMVREIQERMFKIKIFQAPLAIKSEIFLLDAHIALEDFDVKGQRLNWDENEDDSRSKDRFDGQNILITIDDVDELSRKQRELQEVIRSRKLLEDLREKLLRKMINLINKLKKMRAKSNEDWKKKFYERKKLTGPIEKRMNDLRAELELIHSKIVNIMRARLRDTKWIKDLGLPELDKESYDLLKLVTRATKLKQDIEEIQRIVDEGKEKLTVEIKLHCQAEQEANFIQADVTRRNVQMTIIRSKELIKMRNRDISSKLKSL